MKLLALLTIAFAFASCNSMQRQVNIPSFDATPVIVAASHNESKPATKAVHKEVKDPSEALNFDNPLFKKQEADSIRTTGFESDSLTVVAEN